MKLNERFSIEREKYGVILVETVSGKDNKGNDKEKKKNRYYGTLYQALIGFLNNNIDNSEDIDDITVKVKKTLDIIMEEEYTIKEKFCTEVHVSGRRNKP